MLGSMATLLKFVIVVLSLGLLMRVVDHVNATLEIGFYNKTCPSAEEAVRSVVERAYAKNWGIAPALIRMHFHDCFVRGCDGSILLDSTPGNSSEKEAVPNTHIRGFEVIDDAKAMIESQCPSIVSCADILAFAARDSATLTGQRHYQVPAGRRDGRTSIEVEASTNLPSPFFNATQLISNFASKNLSAQEMLTLAGAHSIGVAHCDVFINRLYNFSNSSDVDPTLNPVYATFLQSMCPPNNSNQTDPTTVVPLDILTPEILDNMYYVGLKMNLGLLTSDQALLTETSLRVMVDLNAYNQELWASKFGEAMVKMGQIEVLTGAEGEIRKNCGVVNNVTAESGYLHTDWSKISEVANS